MTDIRYTVSSVARPCVPLLCLLSSLLVPSPLQAHAQDADALDASTAGRPFDARVTIMVNALDMSDFLRLLQEQTGVALQASKEIAGQKVTARLRNRTLREALRALRRLFGYRLWYRQTTGAYILYQGDSNKLREAENALYLDAFRLRLERFRQSLAKDARIDLPINVAERTLARMTPEQIDQLFAKRSYEVPFSALSPLDRDGTRARLSRFVWGKAGQPPRTPSEEEIRRSVVALSIRGEGVDLHLVGGVYFDGRGVGQVLLPTQRTIVERQRAGIRIVESTEGSEHAIMDTFMHDPAEVEPIRPVAAWTPQERPDPHLKRKITVRFFPPRSKEGYTGEPNCPLSPTDDAFQTLASQAAVDFLADSFIREPTVPSDINDMPLGEALDKIAVELGYTWDRSGPIYLFRSVSWWRDDPDEPPAAITRKWLRLWRERSRMDGKPLSAEELASLAYRLTNEQLSSLGLLVPPAASLARSAAAFALYHAASDNQRRQLVSEQGLEIRPLPQRLKDLLVRKLPSDVREELEPVLLRADQRIRIRPERGGLRVEWIWNGGWQSYGFVPLTHEGDGRGG